MSKDKKENTEQKQVWKYPNLPPRPFIYKSTPSLLDEIDERSALNQSHLKGFYNMVSILGTIFFISQPIINFIDHGYFLQPTLFNQLQRDFIFCVITWPLFLLWSYTSYLIQVLIVKGFSPTLATILQHTTQSGLFIYSTIVILTNDWCSTHTVFVILQACVHFMKMHSYLIVNRDYREEYEEAKRQGRQAQSNYPQNVTFKDFSLFMFTPWLVYAVYPRREKINYYYLIKKSFTIVILLIIIYLMNSEYIQPWIHLIDKISAIQLILRLMLPLIVFILLTFYLVFQNMCNFFAQVSLLDHRQFYDDWWNSYTYEQFNRKWNKPVHRFLYRHVYLQLIVRWKRGKMCSQICTFMFSAFLHQFLLAFLFRIIRPIFLMFIIFQVPLIKITKWMEARKAGLYLTWFGLLLGPALILCMYLFIHEDITVRFSKSLGEIGQEQ